MRAGNRPDDALAAGTTAESSELRRAAPSVGAPNPSVAGRPGAVGVLHPVSHPVAAPAAPLHSLSRNPERVTPVAKAPARRARTRLTVSLVIPAKNEARNLPRVLGAIPKVVDEVILVDGLSTDVTHLVATSHRPDIRIVHELRPGKGTALRAGFAAATGDIIVAMDADGSMMPEEIPHLLYFLNHGYDFVKGSRFISGGNSLDITPVRKLGNAVLCSIANTFFRTQFTDLCYGFFAFHRKFLPHLALVSEGFEIETEINVRASKIGLRMAETPSLEMPRYSGSSNLHAVRDGVRVLRELFHERRAPAAKHSDPPADSEGG